MQISTYDPFTGNLIGSQSELDFGTVIQSSHPVKPLLFKPLLDPGEDPTAITLTLTNAGWTSNKYGIYVNQNFSIIQSGSTLFQSLSPSVPVNIFVKPSPTLNYVWLDVDIPPSQTGTTYASISLSTS